MKIIFRRVGFLGWRWFVCAIAHRPFYLQDKKKVWFCDVCVKNELESIRKDLRNAD